MRIEWVCNCAILVYSHQKKNHLSLVYYKIFRYCDCQIIKIDIQMLQQQYYSR